jgi:DNA-binding MarR family transcriptional regulator
MAAAPEPPPDDAIDAIDRMIVAIGHGPDSRHMHRHARAAAGVDLDRPGYTLLLRLAACGGTRLSLLAEMLGLDLSTVSRKAARLEEQGLLERAPDPDDARAVLVHLSDAGRRAVEQLSAARRVRLAAAIEHWSEEDRAELGRLVGRRMDDLLARKQAEAEAHAHAATHPSPATTPETRT